MTNYWSKLKGRQRTSKEERFNYIMDTIENQSDNGATTESKDYDEDITELNNKIASLESTIETLESTIDSMDTNIKELQLSVEALSTQNGDVDDLDEI